MLLCSCVKPTPAPEVSSQVGKYNFSYQVEKKRSSQLIQVFDDGQRTYFHFLSPQKKKPVIRISPKGKPQKYKIDGRYFVVPRVEEEWLVSLGKSGQSRVFRDKRAEYAHVKE